MFYALLLLFVCTVLAYFSGNKQPAGVDNSRFVSSKRPRGSSVWLVALLFLLICFAGLRTHMNDTATYLYSFETKIPNTLSGIKNIDWSPGSNPLFSIYRILLKTILSANGQTFIFISSLITVSSLVLFIRKHAEDFGFSIYLFIAFTVYAFTLAAMKQTMATALAVWAIPLFLQGKKGKASLLILIAMLIHPYVIVYFALFFLSDNVWDKRSSLIILVTLATGFVFTSFVAQALNLISLIGDTYDESWFNDGGVNIARLLVYWATPALSFAFRGQIREKNDRFLTLCVNLSLVSACFMLLASFGGAIMLGRLAEYFDIFTCLALPMIIRCGIPDPTRKRLVTFFVFAGFFFFYFTYYRKYYPSFMGDLFSDYYAHVPISTLFRG